MAELGGGRAAASFEVQTGVDDDVARGDVPGIANDEVLPEAEEASYRPGFTIALHELLTMMIVVSDNACTGIVADLVGLEAVNTLSRAGVPTELPDGSSATGATSLLLGRLARTCWDTLG